MLLERIFTVFGLVSQWLFVCCRSDPTEGTRLIDEAFRVYDKRIRPNYGVSPVIVNVSMHILSISKVDTASMTYTMSFFFRQMWTDSRLSFNSRRNIDTLTLDPTTSESIWVPDTYFRNELSSVNHNQLVKNQFCRISQNGSILSSRRVTLTAFTEMKVNMFPYDSHKLVLELESYGSQTKDLKYQWSIEDISLATDLQIPGFVVESHLATDTSKITSTGTYSCLRVEVKVSRNPLPYELGYTLPTCFLSFLCLISVYFRKSFTGCVIAIYLVSLIAVVYGQLFFNFNNLHQAIPYMTPLHLHALVCCGFGLICLIVNFVNSKPPRSMISCQNSLDEIPENQSKSRTESTSEDSKENLGQAKVALEISPKSKQTIWNRIHTSLGKCCRLDTCLLYTLWLVFISIQLTFVLLLRNFHPKST